MQIFKLTLLGLFFGTFGTTIGGIIGCLIKNVSKKYLSFILSFASGLMMAIITFDLIPEALEIANIINVIIGIIFGLTMMIICEILVKTKYNYKILNSSSLLKTGIIVSIGLAIHNFPEGLAIGSSFDISSKLGIGLAIAICMHDIPEGISMAVPMKSGGMNVLKVLLYTFLSGISTGIGAFFGAIIGNISKAIIAISISFAARSYVIHSFSEN